MTVVDWGKISFKKMRQHPYIFCIIVSLVVWLLRYRSGANGALETRTAAAPTTLASTGSKVTDSWSGSLLIRDLMLSRAEVALVFYYAPWCGKSVDSFRELEAAAEVLHKQVSFIAVNCWWIQGECRGAMQFHKFPQVYLHHKNMRHAVFYNGPLKKQHYIDALLKAMDPVCYLGTREKVEKFLNENQFTVLGYFSFSSSQLPPGFLNYSVLAVKHLETYDVPVQFGAVTDVNIAKVYYLKPNVLQLRDRLRPREVTHFSLNSTVTDITTRLKKLRTKVAVSDVHLPGVKSNFLYQTLHKSPTLITFVSSADLQQRKKYLKKIHQLVFRYMECNSETTSPASTSAIYKDLSLSTNSCCKSVLFGKEKHSDDTSLVCSVCVKRDRECEFIACALFSYMVSLTSTRSVYERTQRRVKLSPETEVCVEFAATYDVCRTRLNICCASADFFFTVLEKQKTKHLLDEERVDEIIKNNPVWSESANVTGIVDTSEEDPSILFDQQNGSVAHETAVDGLGCETNRTLQFLTMDFDRHGHFSQNFGVDRYVYSVDDVKMGAVIVDHANEVHHVMSSSHFHIENFIINFTLGILPRSYHVGDDEKPCAADRSQPCVLELTTLTFEQVALNNEKDVLLLYYVPWCAACTSISHVFLSLANLLNSTSTVLLARIDAYENELPWQFTVQSYPTVILFPARRSSCSAVFPLEDDITIANLLRFLFKNISLESTKQVLFNICMEGQHKGMIQHEACKKWHVLRKRK